MTQENEQDNLNPFIKSSLAYSIFCPTEENLPDVSFIPTGMVHALTNLRAYGYQLGGIIEQIRKRQRWHIERQVYRESVKKRWVPPDASKSEEYGHWQVDILKGMAEQKTIVDERMEVIKTTDVIKESGLFIRQLLNSYFHISRGKNGNFIEKGKDMVDSELAARNPDNEMQDRIPHRLQ